jgi:hypothetical protein
VPQWEEYQQRNRAAKPENWKENVQRISLERCGWLRVFRK